VPLVGGGAHQYPVREADLVEAVTTLATTPDFRSEVLGVASEVPVTFADLLRTFAASEGRRPRFVPVPWRALYWPLRTLEAARVPLPFRADSLLGLVRPAPSVPGVERLHALGIHATAFVAVAA
ncbi:MAG: hypothetical protein JO368_06560, partial [Acidimicrobiales bacterium]|nr:hypothetical protein [Acidimicrobiales bacterium]